MWSLQTQAVLEESSVRSTSPSLLTATVGQRLLSQLDDGSGCTSPEQVIAFWTEEGIRNSRDILQVSLKLNAVAAADPSFPQRTEKCLSLLETFIEGKPL